jgi:hypothetical protein
VTSLQSIAEITDKVFPVLTREDIDALADKIPFPAVGVVYEGIRANDKVPGGAAGWIDIAIVVTYKVEGIFGKQVGQTYQMKALNLLDSIRAVMFATPGPNGKRWMLDSELSPVQIDNITQWVQRWSLNVVLT